MSRVFAALAMPAIALSFFAFSSAQGGTISTTDGTVSVTAMVTQTGPLYQYNYSVADQTGLLAVLDIAVTPGTVISGLTAPGGAPAFTTAYDPILGLVSFLENNAVFSGTPQAGFSFFSTRAPGPSTFGVTLFDNVTGSGAVTGAVGAVSPTVPEPASMTLFAASGAALLLLRKRLAGKYSNRSLTQSLPRSSRV